MRVILCLSFYERRSTVSILANRRFRRRFWKKSALAEPRAVCRFFVLPKTPKTRRAFEEGYRPAAQPGATPTCSSNLSSTSCVCIFNYCCVVAAVVFELTSSCCPDTLTRRGAPPDPPGAPFDMLL